jgi:DNA helicase-2/ATP-dependent DNA helicase PcrA
MVINHGDNVSLRRIINLPARGIGAATLLKIENEAKKKSLCLFDVIKSCIKSKTMVTSTNDKLNKFVSIIEKMSSLNYKSASDLLKNVADKSGYLATLNDERRQNIDELISSVEGENIQEFVDKASLLTNSDNISEGNYISLMTLHNAKGLEFPVVFLTGLEEGLLPYFKANGNEDEISEERRLFYVGMTRAKDFLVLSGARKRRLYAKLQEQEPSRFLKDVPKTCCKWVEKIADPSMLRCLQNSKKKQELKKVRPYFDSGCRVKHPVWGVGVVRDCYGDGEDQKVMVNFPAIGLKRLSLKLANLTKL